MSEVTLTFATAGTSKHDQKCRPPCVTAGRQAFERLVLSNRDLIGRLLLLPLDWLTAKLTSITDINTMLLH